MKRTLISAALAAAAVLAVPATAQMMGGYGGYGPGYGMGPGMMGGYGGGYGYYGNLNLTSEQRAKIAEIQQETRKKQWALMQSMHEVGWNQAAYKEGKFDEAAARKSFEAMTELRKQMFENSLAARKSVDSVLTPEQRKQLGEGR